MGENMSKVRLEGINKIYVSRDNATLGIRDINLIFDIGEFVAITGSSGSGKTTLLNVIGGMDSYEEGELYIDGDSTSHYSNDEWEKYSQRNIAYIFQDYGIIDSFTVLENVQLALLEMLGKKEAKNKAEQIIEKVGLTKFINQKGSKLSGGQKQRVAIARALAKNSSIILADEPTGNLDEANSKEIIKLLSEIAKEKLVIMVTHNYEDVREYATRRITMQDGCVVNDEVIKIKDFCEEANTKNTSRESQLLSRASYLGWKMVKSKPKLTMFIGCLFLVGTMGLFLFMGMFKMLINSVGSEDNALFSINDNKRLVILKRDGESFSKEEIQDFEEKYGVTNVIRCDNLFELYSHNQWNSFAKNPEAYNNSNEDVDVPFLVDSVEENITLDLGRTPENEFECVVCVPYSLMDYFGENTIVTNTIHAVGVDYDVVGVKYYKDNNKMGKMLVSKKGYELAYSLAYYKDSIYGKIKPSGANEDEYVECIVKYLRDVPVGEAEYCYYYTEENESTISNPIIELLEINDENDISIKVIADSKVKRYDDKVMYGDYVLINPNTIVECARESIEKNYKQCSILFDDEKSYESAKKELANKEYYIIPQDAKYIPFNEEVADFIIEKIVLIVLFIALVFILVLAISVCMKNSMEKFRQELKIMRMVGVQKNTIIIAHYIRMIATCIPSFIIVIAFSNWAYGQCFFNKYMAYLYVKQYSLIFIGMLICTVVTTRKQAKVLFGSRIKNSFGRE